MSSGADPECPLEGLITLLPPKDLVLQGTQLGSKPQKKGCPHNSYAKGIPGTAFSLLSRQSGTEPEEIQISSLEGTGQHRAFESMYIP